MKSVSPHSSAIQDTHFLHTSTGWAGSTPTHSDLSSVSLTLTSTFQYSILIRPIFTFNFCRLCVLDPLFSSIFLKVNLFTLSHFLFQFLPTITRKSVLKDKILSCGGPEIWCLIYTYIFNSLEKAPTQAAGSQELNKAAVSGLVLLSKWFFFFQRNDSNKTIWQN